MNQHIQFVDRFEYCIEKQAIKFEAMVSGLLVNCYYPYHSENMATFLRDHQFDLEEMAEALIEDESYNELGEVWLKPL